MATDTRYTCQCIDPITINVANSNPSGTTGPITFPWNNHGLLFDVNVPKGSPNPAMSANVYMFVQGVPSLPNGFLVPLVTDGSGSCLIELQWDEKHDFHFRSALGQAPNQRTDKVLFNLDSPQYPSITVFFQNWPLGWTTVNMSNFLHEGTPLPTENATISCDLQNGSFLANKLNTAAAYSLCSACHNTQPSGSSCSSGNFPYIYILLGLFAFVAGVLLLRRVI